MAININSVYKAVLVVLEQGKRGVLTPNEFSKIATQAQQEIFTQYFDDLNQLLSGFFGGKQDKIKSNRFFILSVDKF